MAIILNIETATTNCSVAVARNGETLALKEDYSQGFSHAEKLHLFINDAIKESNLTTETLDAIAVSKGPGSYTGLRIGVSTAKGLCFGLNKPLISVPTLTSLAHQVKVADGIIVPMLDARRMEVYSAVFDSNYKQVRDTEAQILDETSFSRYLSQGKVHFIGTGVDKLKTIIDHKNAIYNENKLPSANEMSLLSFRKHEKSDLENVAYFEPYYLKDFVGVKQKNN